MGQIITASDYDEVDVVAALHGDTQPEDISCLYIKVELNLPRSPFWVFETDLWRHRNRRSEMCLGLYLERRGKNRAVDKTAMAGGSLSCTEMFVCAVH
jgi:hypothetical protein